VEYAILDLSPNGNIDTTALQSLQELLADYAVRGVKLCLCNPGAHVMEVLVSSGFVDKVGYDNMFVSEHHAISVCRSRLDELMPEICVESQNQVEPGIDVADSI